MKKYKLLFILLLITVYQLSAQKTKDVLYLKNGSVINGTLMEIVDNQFKVRTSDGSLFIFNSSEVDKYLKVASSFEGRKKAGFGFALEAGLLAGSQQSNYDAPFSFNALLSFATETKNVFGLGSGVEFLGRAYTPVFMEFKRLIYDRKTTPFVFLRGGRLLYLGVDESASSVYTWPQTSNKTRYRGGMSLTMGTGISWQKDETEIYLSFAYRYAHTSYTENYESPMNETYTSKSNRLEIKFGFRF